MKQILLTICACLLGSVLIGQDRATLSGYIKDASSGESMIGASILIPELKAGTYSNEYGYYSLSVPKGDYQIVYRFLGYRPDTLTLSLTESITRDVELILEGTQMEEVVIEAESAESRLAATEMGTETLSIETIKKMPVLFGETDVLKSIQLLPGVKPAAEGNSGFFVRGGGADQNLILLDEAPVYNPSHLLGFFSVFNGDAIKSTKLYKGNMPASYGGRLSSALDVRMKDGNNKKFGVSGGIGLISSRLTLEGPIVEDKSSFIISGRRTYADAFLALSNDSSLNNTQLYFYDLNMKANYVLGEKDQIFLSGYFGRDAMGFGDDFGIDWGNATATLRWNHLFTNKLFLNSSFIYSDYDYEVNLNAAQAKITSGIKDFNWKEDFSWYANENNSLDFGLNLIYHTFVPGAISTESEESFLNETLPERYALESAAYISHEVSIGNKLKIDYGLRASNFSVLGPGTVYEYNAEGVAIDSTVYEDGEIIKNYFGLEPRFSASWVLNESQSLKASYARNRQYVHLISSSTTTTPTDVWLPSSEIIKPEIADQFSLGYYKVFPNKGYEGSVEVYYKDLQNQIEYQDGANLLLDETVETQLAFGRGWSYGAEFMLKKTTGKLTGWVSYTWSRTLREFEEINNGEPFSARQDRIHDVSIVASYQLSPKWNFGASWIYATGDAATFPSGSYQIGDQVVPYYTERNGYRFPANHRLDLSATWYGKKPNTNLNFSVYNAYNRHNAFSIDFREVEGEPGNTEAVKTYLFSIIPSITWNFDF
ncbi:MAG: TonB-dependent receptor [Bacteroidota bacterium]